jgi:HSP20 family protein
MLMRFEPFREFDRITEDLLAGRRVRQAPVDAYRRGDRFKIALDLPGVDPGSIEVTVEKEVLMVAATRPSDRGHGQFNRQLFLAESLDREQIRAIYHDGVLTINIPVAERAKPRKVEITHVGSVAQAVEAATVTA